jgi:hypothetical protein
MVASLSRVVAACLLLLSLGGCANYIFRSFDIDSGESLSLDAKQRLVLATYKGGKSGNRKIVCAEPSPDAFSATSASATANAAFTFPSLLPGGQTGTDGQSGNTSGSGGIAAATSESAASIGLRTQTIQLLRDGLYRACEAYMNGAIDQHQYNIILLNIDKLMVTLLGIDAIGGTPKAPPVSIIATAPQVNTTASNKDGATASVGSAEKPNKDESDKGKDDAAQKDNSNKPPKAAQHIKSESIDPAGVQAEAIANIVLAANSHASTPALCISLLASGELRPDNPGQFSVLKSCDYLLHGSIHKALASPEIPTPTRYKMTPPTK